MRTEVLGWVLVQTPTSRSPVTINEYDDTHSHLVSPGQPPFLVGACRLLQGCADWRDNGRSSILGSRDTFVVQSILTFGWNAHYGIEVTKRNENA
jgi:hypothetical protein